MRLHLNQADLTGLLGKIDASPAQSLSARLDGGVLVVQGLYPLALLISFETRWKLSASNGLLAADLVGLSALHFPAMALFKSSLLRTIGHKDRRVSVMGDTVIIELPVRVQSVLVGPAEIVIEGA